MQNSFLLSVLMSVRGVYEFSILQSGSARGLMLRDLHPFKEVGGEGPSQYDHWGHGYLTCLLGLY